MRFVLGWLKAASVVCLGLSLVSNASAGVVIDVSQSGSDVVLSMSGSLGNLGSSISSGYLPFVGLCGVVVDRELRNSPDMDFFLMQTEGEFNYSVYGCISSPGPAWGTGGSGFTSSNSSSISLFNFSEQSLALDSSYSFGTPITSSAIFSNQTLASMGLTNPGSYVYTFGSGSDTDTVTFNISGGGGGGALPEPTSMAIFGLAALGIATYRARRKSIS